MSTKVAWIMVGALSQWNCVEFGVMTAGLGIPISAGKGEAVSWCAQVGQIALDN